MIETARPRRHAGTKRPMLMLALLLTASGASASPGSTTRVSVDSMGGQADSSSFAPSISADGRFVAFVSLADNLVPGDTNGFADVFVHDRRTGATTRVSVASNGDEAQGGFSGSPSISADGRMVAFVSFASNLVPGDTNGVGDIFVHDMETGATTRVSVASNGDEANRDSFLPSISGDGRFVAFQSDATNLVPDDTNGVSDVFVHDLKTSTITRVSVDSNGVQANGVSLWPSVSRHGRFVAFQSDATNLVPGDTNGVTDIFVHDLITGRTTRMSVDSAGQQANGSSFSPSLSANGGRVAFVSFASNLVPGDTNGVLDFFVHDRHTSETTRVSVDSAGNQANVAAAVPSSASISADGWVVAFVSLANNLVPDDTNLIEDVFVHDLKTGTTTRVSVDSAGGQGNDRSENPSLSRDGSVIAFDSFASNLVPGDTVFGDVFVHELEARHGLGHQ